MSEKEFSALDHKEQELFSNKYVQPQEVKRHGGNYITTEIPHAWSDNSTTSRPSKGNSKSFGTILLARRTVII